MKLFKNVISIFVLLIILLLVIPLPPFLLDMMFIFNFTFSIIILLTTMYISETLEFSIFPSLLLITTLFRLALNISSTRLILTKQGEAGAVIKTFGSFVLQGNVVVGCIIFIIIVIVQFIVITKGAERVAEVSARFTLDAMPGKQMAIDADLSSGIITEDEARERRYKVQKEADFYGAMDGATKIVKGDAVASILITTINFLAGTAIGMLQGNMSFGQVISVYSIATVGDGLVSQLPALFISIATGMIVTRSASSGNLNEDVLRQFSSQPKVLMIAGGTILGMILIPGAPILQPVLLAGILIALGLTLQKKQERGSDPLQELLDEQEQQAEMLDETTFYKNIDNVYSLLTVEPLEMQFGYSLIPLADESCGGRLIDRIVNFRRQMAVEMGFVIPSIHLEDSAELSPNQYIIKLRGEEVARGELLTDHYLAIDPPGGGGEVPGIETVEPAYGAPCRWITPDSRDLAQLYGYTVMDPLSVMVTHLTAVIERHAHELLTRTEVTRLLDALRKTAPELVDEAVPKTISVNLLQKVLAGLLKEEIPIRDLAGILEAVLSAGAAAKDAESITEQVRWALKRTITRRFSEDGQIKVMTMDEALEHSIVSGLSRSDQGIYLSLPPDTIRGVLGQINELLPRFQELGRPPVILTSPAIRIYFYHLIEQFCPGVHVLSFREIDSNIQIQALGNLQQN